MLGVGIIVPFLPAYAEKMGAGGILLGLTFSGFSFARLITLPAAGALSDRWGRKSFLVVGLVFYTVCSVAYLAADHPWTLIAVRFLQGMASALILPIAMAAVADYTPPENAGTVMGNFNMPIFIGLGVGPVLGGGLVDIVGIDVNFVVMGMLSFGALLLVIIKVPKLPVTTPHQKGGPGNWTLMTDPAFLAVFIIRFAMAVGIGVILAFLPLLGKKLGLTTSAIGLCLAAQILSVAILQKPFGRLADKQNRLVLAAVSSAISTANLVLVTMVSGFVGLFIICLMWGLAGGLGMPALTAVVIERGKVLGVGMGKAMGMFNVALAGGLGLGPVALGKLYDLMPPHGPFLAAAAVQVIGLIVFFALIRKAP